MMYLPDTAAENTARITATVAPLAAACAGQVVILVDGDRTLSPDDTSRTFLSLSGLDPMVIKRRFQAEGYVFSAFHFHAKLHVELGEQVFAAQAPIVARNAPVFPGALEALAAAALRANVFVVTAGIPRVWRAILDQRGLQDVPVIGGIDPRNPYVFGRSEKAHVARLFLDQASMVVAVGDSDVDTEMLLLADKAVVVVNHRQNDDLMPHLTGRTNVWQVVPRGRPHLGIPELSFAGLPSLIGSITAHK